MKFLKTLWIFFILLPAAAFAGSFPTVSLIDDFNRASLGGDYTTLAGTPAICDSIEFCGGSSGNNITYYDVSQYGPDIECRFEVATKPGNTESMGFFYRFNVGTGNGYLVDFLDDSGTDDIRIRRIDGWGATTILTVGQEVSATDTIGARVVNDVHYLYRNNSMIGSAVDTDYDVSGYFMPAVGNTTGRMDNFYGGAVTIIPTPLVFMHLRR